MEQLILQMETVGRSMWKYRWPALIVSWLVALLGGTVVMLLPNRYEASARIYVDTGSILKPLMAGLAVQPNVDQQVAILSRTLLSRPNLERLIGMLNLDLEDVPREEQDALVDSLARRIEVRSANRDNLYTLSLKDENPAKAQRVVESLVSIFVESSLGNSRKDTENAKDFINEQISAYRVKLEEAEARLKQFRLHNIELQHGEGMDSASRLIGISAQIEQARLQLKEAENTRDAARAQLEAEKRGEDLLKQSLLLESSLIISTPEIDARIEDQRRHLDKLRQRLTEIHPEVRSTQRVLRDLEAQKAREVEEKRQAAMEVAASTSYVSRNSSLYQELHRVVANAEVQVAAMRGRVEEYLARYNRALELAKSAPQLEAELAQLNRDYEIHKRKYEELVGRRESAALSGQMDGASKLANFRLIDPPWVNPKPVSPNRSILLPGVLLASIAAGVFSAFIMSQLRPVFHHPADLKSKLSLPFLGGVSMVMSEVDKRRERIGLMLFLAVSMSLLGVFLVASIAVKLMAEN